MDKNKSWLKALSTSAVIFLSWETLVVAENVPKAGDYYRSKDFLLAEFPTVNKDAKKNRLGYKQIPIQVSQAQQTELTEVESLGPNSNPLTFPTKPEEVEPTVAEAITLEQAIELALRNNQDLQVSKLNLQLAEQELREARAALYPDLEAQLGVRGEDVQKQERNNQGQATSNSFEDLSTTITGTIELSYDIYAGGGRSADIKRAKKQFRINELDVERITEQTRFEAVRDYYSLQDADAQVEIAKAAIEDASQTLRDAQLLEQAGLGTRFDVLRAEVGLADDRQNLSIAISNQKSARRRLARTLSIGQQVNLVAADKIEEAGTWPISLEETIILAYRNRAELEQQIVSRELNEQQRQIALSAIRPQVSLFAAYDYRVDDIFEDNRNTANSNDDENQYRFGATLNWRLFDGGAANARADQEETDIEISETQFADQRNQVRLEVEEGYFSLQANKENIGTSQKAVELAEESLRLARLRFQAGVGTQTDVIEAQSALTDARANFLRAIIEYNQSLNQLQRAVTNLPEGKLFDLP